MLLNIFQLYLLKYQMSFPFLLVTQGNAQQQVKQQALEDTASRNKLQLYHKIVPGNVVLAVVVMLLNWAVQVTSVSFVTLTTLIVSYNPTDVKMGVLCSYTTSLEDISKLMVFVLTFLAKQAAFPMLPSPSRFFDFITMTCGLELF